MTALDLARELGHEALHLFQDRASGLRAVIALHDTSLGPAVGGTRMRLYPSLDEAATDALRLARGMTRKAAMAGLRCGGGKARDPGRPGARQDPGPAGSLRARRRLPRRPLLHRLRHGRDRGRPDLHARLHPHLGHTGAEGGLDTSDLAAMGTCASIEAVAERLGRSLEGLHVALQGLGQVGIRLARQLRQAGCRLTVADVDAPAWTGRGA